MNPSLRDRATAWLERPLGAGPTLALGALTCAAAAWLTADPLRTFFLMLDDFTYLAESRTWPRLLANLWTPHNAHIVPLFRIWTYLLVTLAGNLRNLPAVVGVASFSVLVLVMLVGGHFVARETNDASLGLAAMALLGVTTVMQPAAVWYSAGQALWSALGILAMLTALQAWRASGRAWRMVLAVLSIAAASGFWSGGYAAGPVGLAYLWTDRRSRCRKASVVPIATTVVLGLAALTFRGHELMASGHVQQRPFAVPQLLLQGVLHTCQAIPESLVMANLGLDTVTTASQGVVLTLALVGLWAWSRWSRASLNPLEAAGGMLVVSSFLLVYTFRGYESYSSLRTLGWYQAIPQVGAVLFAAGWWQGNDSHPSKIEMRRSLTRGGAVSVLALVAVLFVMQIPRAERLFVGHDALSSASNEETPDSAQILRVRTLSTASERASQQLQFLARLDEAERTGRRDGIGLRAIKASFGRIIGPGIPKEITSLDAADLLALPQNGRENDPVRIRAELGHLLTPAP